MHLIAIIIARMRILTLVALLSLPAMAACGSANAARTSWCSFRHSAGT